MSESIDYSIMGDTMNGAVNPPKLNEEIYLSSIVTALEGITTSGDTLTIIFKAALSPTDADTLDDVIAAHDGIFEPPSDLVTLDGPKDQGNRPYMRNAITEPGWAYLALFIEINAFSKTNPVRVKRFNGDDYSYTVSFFNAEYGGTIVAPTTQLALDLAAKRMEISLDLEADFDLIGGKILSKMDSSSQLYVDVACGAAALGDEYMIPFVKGAPLHDLDTVKTDGRSSKKLEADIGVPGVNGNVFKIYIRRPSLLSVEVHRFNMIYELYRGL